MPDNERTAGATREAPAAPAISAPKGGGAIRGIGEKFTANAASGTGTLTVPITLAAGRSDLGPKLSLTYDSAAGNGPFGVGWHVSLPSITRKTDKGLPRYGDADVFILSGAEDLVPVADPVNGDGYSVQAFRPRTEGLFARIERWTRTADGDTHWRSISSDNVLTVYGLDAGSRVADPDDSTRVFSWLICASYDDRGNAIAYGYRAENADNVNQSAPGERHRTRGATRYPDRIRYGNATPLLLDPTIASFRRTHVPAPDVEAVHWLFDVVFDYGQGNYAAQPPDPDGRVLVDAAVIPTGTWPVRSDPFSAYRSGFEVRTYRLCRRILLFHHFPTELGADDYLVSSTRLSYQERPTGSLLTQAVSSGYRRQSDGRYLERSRPALQLDYSPSPLDDPDFDGYEVHEVDTDSARNLPTGWDERDHQWIDLDGDGTAGVLTEQADAWFYKPNLGGGRLGPARLVPARPGAAQDGRTQLVDLAGTGQQELVTFTAMAAGFQGRTQDAGWDRFRAFESWPTLDWADPRVRLTDVTGDGLADVLVTEDECLTWHASLGHGGFGPGVRVRVPPDEERGPQVAFADGMQSVYLADLSGDGLSDIVRIRNGDVCYWPNLGYGQFGAKVTMADAPWFDRPDLFDQRRIRLADTDGSGPADLVYLGRDGVRIYLNESGNGWSQPRFLPQFPIADDHSHVSVVDLLGRGTSCLCWSSPMPGSAGPDARRPLRYLDVMAGNKPHLLVGVRNNLGAETVVEYTASTQFSLADAEAGTPWITRLPFPVHVVSKVTTYDRIARNRFVSRYSYHHGYFDPIEREFRGFGRVDQWDTEEFGALTQSGAFPVGDNVDASSHLPPVLTKTWYHTGVFSATAQVSQHLAHEYYREDGLTDAQVSAALLDDTPLPDGLTAEEARQACRALRGSVLRQEVYAEDDRPESTRPYAVSERNYTIVMLHPSAPDRHAVFLAHPREVLDYAYDRKAYPAGSDPRISHQLTLDVDDYGDVLLAASVGYGRRFDDPDPRLTTADRSTQKRTLVTYVRRGVTNPVLEADAWRVPQPAEDQRYELVNVAVTATNRRFGFDELAGAITASGDGAHDLAYQDFTGSGATATGAYRRLIGHERMLYRPNDLTAALALSQVQALALPYQTHRLALTADLGAQAYDGFLTAPALDSALTTEGGFIHSLGDAGWWTQTPIASYSTNATDSPAQELTQAVAHFFRERRHTDPFGHHDTVDFDPYDLLTLSAVDAVGNTTTAGERGAGGAVTANGNDYRVLGPALVTDPNGNRTQVAYDTLGEVVGTAVMGKSGENIGDSLTGFEPDLTDAVIAAHLADPLADVASILGRATTRTLYDGLAFARTGSQPAVTATFARETHDADLTQGQSTKVNHGLSYSDGFGREIQKKTRAEPGPVADGGPVLTGRWVTSGWTIVNNKGKTVRAYEPFFHASPTFTFGNQVGVSPIACYDPIERVVAVVHPNHAWEKAVYDPWRKDVWDVNDTVAIADPASDADCGGVLSRLPDVDYLPTWYAARAGGALGAAEQDAAVKASAHAATPSVSFMDALGRTFLVVAHNRTPGATSSDPPVEEFYRSRFTIDIDGNQREVYDPAERLIMRYDCDLLGGQMRLASMEAGVRLNLADIGGRPIRRWDSRGHAFTTSYDALRRPVARSVRGADPVHSDPRTLGVDVLYEKLEYGEGQPDDVHLNLRTRVVATYDGAGVDRTDEYDFKGNPVRVSRRLATRYDQIPDWAGTPLLDGDTFTNLSGFDALSRAVHLTTPDGAVAVPAYNEAGLLNGLAITLPNSGAATAFVTNIDYNARGDRTRIEFGNGAATDYAYDPYTFRLTGLTTTRPASANGPAAQVFVNPATVQDLRYTFDPAGNLTTVTDDALLTLFYNGAQVAPVHPYTYDAIYRLVQAHGREHLDQSAAATTSDGNYRDYPFVGANHPSDLQAVRDYTERYAYDQVGNLTSMAHQATNGGWTRTFVCKRASLLEPTLDSNALSSSALGLVEAYDYDPHGATVTMPHLSTMEWDFKGQLRTTARQVVNDAQPERTYYTYSVGGQRMRKVTVRGDGSRRTDRCYLRGWERYREYAGDGTTVAMTRDTLHVMDAERRIALVETLTAGAATPVVALRYQFTNHLDSATVELDGTAGLISYEEFTPYGSSAYQVGRSAAEVSLKRYRYTGRERDEETGFTYHGARYFAPWLGRWISCDPAGLKDGPNLYLYARGNPCRLTDPNGTQAQETQKQDARVPDPLPADTVDNHGNQGTGDGTTGDPPRDPGTDSASPADPAQPAAGSSGGAAPAKGTDDTPAATGASTQPAAAQHGTTFWDRLSHWLHSETKVEYKNWKTRTWLSYVLAGLFIALALLLVLPLTKTSPNDPLWFKVARIGITVIAGVNLAYRALVDFGTEQGGKQASVGDHQALDLWSVVHTSAGVVMGLWRVPFPVVAVLTVAWEGVEMTVPGFGDHEINANRMTDITLAWTGWFTFAGLASYLAKAPLPLGQRGNWW